MIETRVVVAGCGPAGSWALYNLAKNGVPAVGLEKHAFPRYKPCGGGLSPKLLQVLPADKLKPLIEVVIKKLVFTFNCRDRFPIESGEPIAFMLRRPMLDKMLADHAAQAGAKIYFGQEVTGIQQHRDYVIVNTPEETYRAAFLLGSDGATGITAREFSHGSITSYPTITCMAEGEFPGKSQEGDAVWINLGPKNGVYGWIFPKKDYVTVGLGIFKKGVRINLKETMDDMFRVHPALKGMKPGKYYGHPLPVRKRLGGKLGKGRVLFLGDAAGLVDPFLGEGIIYALRSGELAAGSVSSENLPGPVRDNYSRAVAAEMFPQFRSAGWIAALIGSFPSAAYKLLKDHASLSDFYRGVMMGESKYTEVVSRIRNRLVKDHRLPSDSIPRK
ncbi:MAG: geranylgeranyl reductase family protein [Chloroflexi bacterium]|nr:geranylgeranyl reductase family protein [Chloroflexota bacterium]